MGAHDTPKGVKRSDYVEEILSDQLPKVLEQGYANAADVFCEPGWFTVEESESILLAAGKGGLRKRIHIDEFQDGGGGELAASMGVVTADHAHYTAHETRSRMESPVSIQGFCLGPPTLWVPIGLHFQMRQNKGLGGRLQPTSIQTATFSACHSLVRCLFIATKWIHCSALVASTRNAAETTPHPTGRPHGRIEVGAVANLNILDGTQWQSWCNRPGTTPFKSTMLNGTLVHH